HPEQSDLGGLAMQLARQLAVALPLVLVGQDVLLGEPGGHLPQCLAFRGVERAGHNSSSGMSTCLLRNHSPSALACGSKRACDATPCPSRPLTTKFIALRFGSRYRRTGRSAVSGSSRRNSSTVRVVASHRHAASVRTQTPTLASPPLSPLRAPATRPSGARRYDCGRNGSGSSGSGRSVSSCVRCAGAIST